MASATLSAVGTVAGAVAAGLVTLPDGPDCQYNHQRQYSTDDHITNNIGHCQVFLSYAFPYFMTAAETEAARAALEARGIRVLR